MTSPRSHLPADIPGCHELIGQLDAIIAERDAKIAEQQQTIDQITAGDRSLKRDLFDSRRERHVEDEEEQRLLFDARLIEPEAKPAEPSPPPALPETKRTSRGRQRRVFPEFLPRVEQRHGLKPEEIPEEMRDNPRARHFFKKIGETLELVPMRLKVVEQYQEVIMLDKPDETVAVAAAKRPASLVQSFAGTSVLACLTVCRFADHIPYYRLENMLGRCGYGIERSTQWRWMRELAVGVARLTDLMWTRARQSSVLGMDETYLKELCGRSQTLTGYLWGGVGDERHPYDCLFYTSSRRSAGREAMLAGFQGDRVADAYVAYERIGALWPGVTKAGCRAHARRKFEVCHHLGPTAPDAPGDGLVSAVV